MHLNSVAQPSRSPDGGYYLFPDLPDIIPYVTELQVKLSTLHDAQATSAIFPKAPGKWRMLLRGWKKARTNKSKQNLKTQPCGHCTKMAMGEMFDVESKMFFQATKRKRPRVGDSDGHVDYISKSDTMVRYG